MNFFEKREKIVQIEEVLRRLPEEKKILLNELQKECEHQVIVSSVFDIHGGQHHRHRLCAVCLTEEHHAIDSAEVLTSEPIKEVDRKEYYRLRNGGIRSLMDISVPENFLFS